MFARVFILLTLIATVASAQTPIFVNDTFTVTADTALEAHMPDIGGKWVRGTGSKGIVVKAASDSAYNIAANDWDVYTNAAPAPDDEYFVKITVTFTNTNAKNFVDLYGRADTKVNNGYAVRISANGTVTLMKYVASAMTTLATGTTKVTVNTPIHLTLVIDDNFKRASIDGATVVNSSDNTITAAGLAGFGMQSYALGQTITDDFSATAIAP